MEKMKNLEETQRQKEIETSREDFDLRIEEMAKEMGVKPKNLLADYAHEEKFLRTLQQDGEEKANFEDSKVLGESIFRTIIERIRSGQDGLTGLPNRLALEKEFKRVTKMMKVGQMEDRRRKEEDREVLPHILMFDIDNFGSFNNDYGHQAGDKVLREFAQTIKGCLREDDFVARYGGEEFLAVVPAQGSDALRIAEKIREAVEKKKVEISPELRLSVTVSIGVSPYLEDQDCEVAVKKADQAMYLSKGKEVIEGEQAFKNQGETKNQIWYFEPKKNVFEKFEREK